MDVRLIWGTRPVTDQTKLSWIRRAENSAAYQFVSRISEQRDRVHILLLNLVLLPGVAVRVGLRQLAAWVLGVRIAHFGFGQVAGGHVVLSDESARWQRAAVVLAAPLLLLPIGTMLSAQLIVDQVTLQSFVPVPAGTDVDSFANTALEAMVRFEPSDFLRIWCTVSCWFMIALPYRDVMAVLTHSDSSEDHRMKQLRWWARPIASLAWIGSRLGPLAGLATVLMSNAASALVTRWIVGMALS